MVAKINKKLNKIEENWLFFYKQKRLWRVYIVTAAKRKNVNFFAFVRVIDVLCGNFLNVFLFTKKKHKKENAELIQNFGFVFAIWKNLINI